MEYLRNLFDVAVVIAMVFACVLLWQGIAAAQSIAVYVAGT